MKKVLFFLILWHSVFCSAQTGVKNRSILTVESIMRDPDKWVGVSPSAITWSDDSKTIYFNWNPEKDTLASLHEWQEKTGEIKKVSPAEKKSIPGRDGVYNSDFSLKVFTRDGNLFLLNLKKNTEQQLTGWLGNCSGPRFIKGGKYISYIFNQNIYLLSLETGLISQLTNFTAGEEKTEREPKGQAAWLKNQQSELFGVLKERKQLNKTREYRLTLEKADEPVKVYTGNSRVYAISLSPSGRFVIFTLGERSPEGGETTVTSFVTESGYTETQRSRAKVGGQSGTVKMGIIDLDKKSCLFVKTDSIPGINDIPLFNNEYPMTQSRTELIKNGRKVSLQGPLWHETEDRAVIVALSSDNKDRWILLLDPLTGKYEPLDRQHDEAWIGGPGIGGLSFYSGSVGWMPDGNSVWFQSEESGFSHLFAVNCSTKKKVGLTSGKFEVYEPFISRDKKYFYFTANREHPGVRHFYRMPVWGGSPEQITGFEGNNDVSLSPDGKTLAILFSSANQPWELYVQENRQGAAPVKITSSVSEEFRKYNWRIPEFITFKSDDSAEVHARLYRPGKAENNSPAVIFVHGAGYLQNAHKWWSSYEREYFFNNFLVDNGYTVLDIDYRGSSGYGRDWRTGIYRHMGGKDLTDHVYGARFLVEKCGVSPFRIGLYGGSYGGFITLMGMFLHPEVFKAGAALRAVTDWAHYN